MKSAPAIGFEYHASRALVAATIVVAMLAVAAVWISGLPESLRLLAAPCIAGWTAYAITRLLLPRVRALSWQADGGARILIHDHRRNIQSEVQGVVQGARVMGPLIVLMLRWQPRERATIWLLPDNLDASTRRRLRIRLGAASDNLGSGNADSE